MWMVVLIGAFGQLSGNGMGSSRLTLPAALHAY